MHSCSSFNSNILKQFSLTKSIFTYLCFRFMLLPIHFTFCIVPNATLNVDIWARQEQEGSEEREEIKMTRGCISRISKLEFMSTDCDWQHNFHLRTGVVGAYQDWAAPRLRAHSLPLALTTPGAWSRLFCKHKSALSSCLHLFTKTHTEKMLLLSLSTSSWEDSKIPVLLAAKGLSKPCNFGRGKWWRRWICKGKEDHSSELEITAQFLLSSHAPTLWITLENLCPTKCCFTAAIFIRQGDSTVLPRYHLPKIPLHRIPLHSILLE